MKLGISIKDYIGVGDKVQFSSLPENYFRATGKKLIDVSKSWIYDFNPFIERDVEPDEVFELWNFPTLYEWPRPHHAVYKCNAEIWASLFKVPTILNRPRLYRFEDWKFENREFILFHTQGRMQGALPDHVIDHVIKKYKKTGRLYHVGLPGDPDYGIEKISTPTLWSFAELVSQARMFIGVDSGPSWIAACYQDVILKKVRIKEIDGQKLIKDWIPLEIDCFHSHWDDRLFQIHNTSEDDQGFTSSYKRL